MWRAGGVNLGLGGQQQKAFDACPFWALLTQAGADGCDLMPRSVPGVSWNSDIKTSGTHSGPPHLTPAVRSRSPEDKFRSSLPTLDTSPRLPWPYKVELTQLLSVYQVCNIYGRIISTVIQDRGTIKCQNHKLVREWTLWSFRLTSL